MSPFWKGPIRARFSFSGLNKSFATSTISFISTSSIFFTSSSGDNVSPSRRSLFPKNIDTFWESSKDKSNLPFNSSFALKTSSFLRSPVAMFFGNRLLIEGETLSPEELVKKIDEVEMNEIVEVAKDLFKPEKLNLALIGPFQKGDITATDLAF